MVFVVVVDFFFNKITYAHNELNPVTSRNPSLVAIGLSALTAFLHVTQSSASRNKAEACTGYNPDWCADKKTKPKQKNPTQTMENEFKKHISMPLALHTF